MTALDDPFYDTLTRTESTEASPGAKRYYHDLNTAFPINGRNINVYDINAINNQIFNLLATIPGERPFEPEFGSNVPYLLFEPVDAKTAWSIEHAVFSALNRWMNTRIILNTGATRIIPLPKQAAYDATISYTIILNNINAAAKFQLQR